MPRYIDAENVIDAIKSLFRYAVNNVAVIDVDEAMATVYAIPTADVRENRRGNWIWEEVDCMDGIHKYHQVRCSCCGERFISEVNFCPNCGADMREEK